MPLSLFSDCFAFLLLASILKSIVKSVEINLEQQRKLSRFTIEIFYSQIMSIFNFPFAFPCIAPWPKSEDNGSAKATERDTKVKQTLRYTVSWAGNKRFSLALKTSICYNSSNNSNSAHNNNNNLTANLSIPRNAATFQLYLDRYTYIYKYINGWSSWNRLALAASQVFGGVGVGIGQPATATTTITRIRGKKSIVQVKVKLFEELFPDAWLAPTICFLFVPLSLGETLCIQLEDASMVHPPDHPITRPADRQPASPPRPLVTMKLPLTR